ncbi:MAG: pyrimidine 5'-nucleotidase [Alphaproteobacteria bacterium]
MSTPARSGNVRFDSNDIQRLRALDTWIFDLDNTLYPRHTNLFAQVDQRIRDYVARLLDLDGDAAHRLQKKYYRRYGTTLRGLMQEHGIPPDEFLEYVHDIDHSPVEPNPVMAAAIRQLPGRKFILTNGSRPHAEKVAARLGITDHFEDIFDIVWADLLPKPERATYDKFLAATGVDPATAIMFEDLARNLAVPRVLGMTTVLVTPGGTGPLVGETWELEGHDGDHIDYVTDDLTHFLADTVSVVG